MLTQLAKKIKKWCYVFRHGVFDNKTSLTRYLFSVYWNRKVDAALLYRLIEQFANEALPLLSAKITTELGEKRYQEVERRLRIHWLEHYLVWAYEGRLAVKYSRYVPEQLYQLAERELYRQLPWATIVRNVPTGCWLNTFGINASTFLHLALGNNIRRHPDYRHFTRKMAHVYHTDTSEHFSRQPNGIGALLIALGEESPAWQVCQALRQCVAYPYEPTAFRKMIPLAEMLLAFHRSGNCEAAFWEKGSLFLQSNWKQRSRQILRLDTVRKFAAAVERHLEEVENRIHLEELMAEHNYDVNDAWPAGELQAWNRREEEGWYQIIELRTPAALVLEGARMHHCVGSYVEECLEEGHHIYSLRFRAMDKTKWRSVVTMSVVGKTINEMEGLLNTTVEKRHRVLIDAWLKEQGGVTDLD